MASRNDVTGDLIQSKTLSAEDQKKFDEGYERIFGKNKKQVKPVQLDLFKDEFLDDTQDV